MSAKPLDTSVGARLDPELRPGLGGSAPYGAPQLPVPHPLNVNENPFGPSEEMAQDVAAAVADAVRTLNRYPDREFLDLRHALAAHLAEDTGTDPLPAEQIWAANGSNEIMAQLLSAFGGPGRTVLAFAPHYSMYPEYARNTLTGFVVAERGPAPGFALTPDRIREAIDEHEPDIVLLTSPNNPTGTALDPDAAAAALDAVEPRGGIVVVDEAYAEFRRAGVPSAVELLDGHPGLVVSRTMSKAFALAGARIGYAAASRHIIDAMRVVRLPYHLSAVTQAVARTALEHRTELLAQVDLLRRERDDLAAHLRAEGYEVADSDANFLLLRTRRDRHEVFGALLEDGILVREVGPPGWLRVSVGTPDDNRAFIRSLDTADPRRQNPDD